MTVDWHIHVASIAKRLCAAAGNQNVDLLVSEASPRVDTPMGVKYLAQSTYTPLWTMWLNEALEVLKIADEIAREAPRPL